jgi:DNA polymerase III epsilon subunit-like protein
MSKIALTDLETTGLNPNVAEIVEIACIIFDSHTFEIEKEFEIKIMPTHIMDADPKALEVNGFNLEEWEEASAVDLHTAMTQFAAFTKDAVFMAFNSPFDIGFLDHAARETGIKMTYRWYPLCLRSIAWTHMPHTGMFNWSLKEVCEKLGVPPEPAVHRAMNGVMAEYGVYKALLNKGN